MTFNWGRPPKNIQQTDCNSTPPSAYWLLDEIALAQRYQKAVAAEESQVWTLTVKDDRTAALSCEDGNGKTVFEKVIPFTDFPAKPHHPLV